MLLSPPWTTCWRWFMNSSTIRYLGQGWTAVSDAMGRPAWLTLSPKEEGGKGPVKTFKDSVPGFVYVDLKYLPQMPDEDSRQYLFAAIERSTRWVLEILPTKAAKHASAFFKRLIKVAPFIITKVLDA